MKMNNLKNKKLMTFGILGLLSLALVSAGLIAYYGQIQQDVNVEQAITLSEYISLGLAVAGSETAYSNVANVVSHTVNDLYVKFDNICSPDCDGITITNMVELSVVGASGAEDPFAREYYKASDYLSPVNLLSDLNSVEYSFEIISNTMANNLAPYIVIIGSGIGEYGVAVQVIPDGGVYSIGEKYTKTLEDATFHIPGVGTCTQSSPCSLAEVKTRYPAANISKVRLALGAWTGTGTSTEISILMGIGKVNGGQVEHKSLKIYGETTIPTVQKYEFAQNIKAGTYTITTEVLPVTA